MSVYSGGLAVETSEASPVRLTFTHLRVLAVVAAGIAVFGVVDGTLWRVLPSPTLGYRTAVLFAFTLLFGWRGLVWGQLLYLMYFSSYFGWRGAVFVEPPYLISHACALVVAQRLARGEPWLSRERSTLAFLAGAVLAPLVPALLNDLIFRNLGVPPRVGVPSAVTSVLREGAAILALGPAVLVYGSGRLKEWVGQRADREWPRINAADVLKLGLEVVAWTATLWISIDFKARYNLDVTYVTFLPPLVFTLRQGMRLAALALAANAISATTLWNLLHWGQAVSAGDLRLLIAIYSLTILVVAAVVDERERGKIEIDERKQAEAVLRESEKRFRTLADSAPVMIWVSGLDKLCNFVNKPWLDFTGRTMQEEMGNGWASSVHPEDVEHCFATYASSFDARRSFMMECRFRRADGEYRWILVNGAPQYRDSRFLGYIGSCVDVTEQKLATERLRASEARLRHAQHLAKVGSWERHLETGKMHWSEEKLRIVGLSSMPPNFESCLDHVHPEDRQRFREIEGQVRSSHGPVEVEYRIIRRDGELRFLRSITEGIRNERGELVHLAGATQDVTDLRRAQEEAFARQKLETVGTLANGIAHDFNNILGGVLAQAESALAELADGLRPEEELRAICDVAVRGSEIVRQLMIYAGKESETLGLADILSIVKEMLELIKVSVSKHAIIETDLASGLPAVRANPGQISQLVMNLVMNASEAIGDRDGVIRVATRRLTFRRGAPGMEGLAEGDYVQLIVSDTGCGMPPQTQARVFDPFFSTKAPGRGLGLAVVQGTVRRLGGVIHLTSEQGRGTTVQVSLPCAENASAATSGPTSHTAQPGRASQVTTVLIVEDEDALLQATSKILRRTGFSVTEATNGSAALDALRELRSPIDVLLLDITLPGAPSWEVLQEARRLRPETKVIVTSAYTEDMASASLRSPIQHFLRKPYRLDALVEMIRQSRA